MFYIVMVVLYARELGSLLFQLTQGRAAIMFQMPHSLLISSVNITDWMDCLLTSLILDL